MWSYNYSYSDELYHHGIKGMKWGVRRFQNEDGTRTAAGKKRYSEANSSKAKEDDVNENQKKGLTDKQKKILKIGAAAAGTALVAYGSYKVYQAYTGSGQKIDPDTGFRLLNKDMSTQQHLNAINPGRIRLLSLSGAKNKEIISGSSANCMLCTTSYELRKRGYDVHAGKSWKGYMPNDLFGKIYKDYKGTTKLTPGSDADQSYYKIIDTLRKEGSGSRGNIVVWWKGYAGGHSMIWENVDGNIKFMDGQTGKEYKNFAKEILSNIHDQMPIELLRTDNLSINVPEMKNVINSDTTLKTYVKNGAEIATNLATDPRIAIPAYVAATAAGSVTSAKQSYKNNKRVNK